MKVDVAIVGGGVGGLALAVALARKGIEAAVFERARKEREHGTGMVMWTGAILELAALGVDTSFLKPSGELWRGEYATSDGRVLATLDMRELSMRCGGPSYMLARASLLEALEAAVAPGVLHPGAACKGVRQGSDRAFLDIEGIGEVTARAVIGADGLRSQVRAAVLGSEPLRYSGETCYRGIVPIPPPELHLFREVHGVGMRYSVNPIEETSSHFWVLHTAPQGAGDDPRGRKVRLLEILKGAAFDIVPSVEATPEEEILHHDLFDRPPAKTWTRGRITLLGDAAHPTTPNLAQGACMAIEDAVVLARMMAAHPWQEAFARYEAERLPRTTWVVRRSRLLGRISQSRSPGAVLGRTAFFRWFPRSLARRIFANEMTPLAALQEI